MNLQSLDKYDFVLSIKLNSNKYNKIAFADLCKNPNAIHFIIRNKDLLDGPNGWFYLNNLCLNPCPKAIQLLKENPDKIIWSYLSWNPCPEALKLLRNNPDKIVWWCLSWNPGIWMDTYKVAQREYFRKTIAEELMAMVWHPKNIGRFEELGM